MNKCNSCGATLKEAKCCYCDTINDLSTQTKHEIKVDVKPIIEAIKSIDSKKIENKVQTKHEEKKEKIIHHEIKKQMESQVENQVENQLKQEIEERVMKKFSNPAETKKKQQKGRSIYLWGAVVTLCLYGFYWGYLVCDNWAQFNERNWGVSLLSYSLVLRPPFAMLLIIFMWATVAVFIMRKRKIKALLLGGVVTGLILRLYFQGKTWEGLISNLRSFQHGPSLFVQFSGIFLVAWVVLTPMVANILDIRRRKKEGISLWANLSGIEDLQPKVGLAILDAAEKIDGSKVSYEVALTALLAANIPLKGAKWMLKDEGLEVNLQEMKRRIAAPKGVVTRFPRY